LMWYLAADASGFPQLSSGLVICRSNVPAFRREKES
jgi:hypothetical protein